jgi:hypothetical protein
LATVDESMGTDEVAPETKEKKTSRSTRRQLLKLAGATLAGAAGGAALKAAPALAYDGQIVRIGTVYGETLGYGTGAYTTHTYTSALMGFGVTGGIGVYGSTGYGFFAYGVYGRASGVFGTGIKGHQTGFGPGVTGTSAGGTGVYGNAPTGVIGVGTYSGVAAYTGATNSRALYAYTSATNSVGVRARSLGSGGVGVTAVGYDFGVAGNGGFAGVYGFSSTAFGVFGVSKTGVDVKLSGTGRLSSVANITGGVFGAPTFTPGFGNFIPEFETVRDSYGGMWISRNQGSGQAGWKKVNAVRADSDDGTGTAFKPFRIVDTRGSTGGFIGPHGTGNHTFQIAGQGAGKQHIPADAVAIFGNLTVTSFTGTGWLTLVPAGVAHVGSDPSSVNWGPGMQPAIANSFFIGLGTGANAGKLTVYVNVSTGSNINYILDITGYSH